MVLGLVLVQGPVSQLTVKQPYFNGCLSRIFTGQLPFLSPSQQVKALKVL